MTLPVFGAAGAAGQHRLAGALRTKGPVPTGTVLATFARPGARFRRGADPGVAAGRKPTAPLGAGEGLALPRPAGFAEFRQGHTGPGATVVVPVEAVAAGEVGGFGAGFTGSGAEHTTTGGAAVVGQKALVFPRRAGVPFSAASDTTPQSEITTQAGARTLQVRLTGLAEPRGRPTTRRLPRDRRAHQIHGAAAGILGTGRARPEGSLAAPRHAGGPVLTRPEPRSAATPRAHQAQATMSTVGGEFTAVLGGADITPLCTGRPEGQGHLTPTAAAGDAAGPTITAEALVVAVAAAAGAHLRGQDPRARPGEFATVEGRAAVAPPSRGHAGGLSLGIVAQTTRLHRGLQAGDRLREGAPGAALRFVFDPREVAELFGPNRFAAGRHLGALRGPHQVVEAVAGDGAVVGQDVQSDRVCDARISGPGGVPGPGVFEDDRPVRPGARVPRRAQPLGRILAPQRQGDGEEQAAAPVHAAPTTKARGLAIQESTNEAIKSWPR